MNRNPQCTYVRRIFIFFALVLIGFSLKPAANAAKNEPAKVPTTNEHLAQAYAKLPLSFEANTGQTSSKVKFLSRGPGYSLFLTKNAEAVLQLNAAKTQQTRGPKANAKVAAREPFESTVTSVFRLKLVNAQHPRSEGLEQLPGKANYFIGNDPTKWRTNVPIYAKVNFHGVYPGVDLAYYGDPQRLEYDFIVAPNADPDSIAMVVDGAKMSVDPQGNLLLKTIGGEIAFERPIAYQMVNGNRREIPSRYLLKSAHRLAFQVAAYDRSQPLVIDPVLSYSTYLGGSSFEGDDIGHGIAVDSSGNAYVTGTTASADFPTTPSAFQTTGPAACRPGFGPCSSEDSFVTKLDLTGSTLIYSTYLGGNTSKTNEAHAITVDTAGNVYVTGFTNASDFPTTPGVFQPTLHSPSGGFNAFITKLNPTGTGLVYSTYLGGSGGRTDQFGQGVGGDQASAIAVDASGNAYVTGGANSMDFPTTAGAFQPTSHASDPINGGTAFITKLGPDGSALIYSTYLGGSGDSVGDGDLGNGIALDSTGNAYIAGFTGSSDFPTTPGAFQFVAPIPVGGACSDGRGDGFVTKLNATGTGLVYSTYLGGGDFDWANSIAVDASGNAYVAGYTFSLNFPTTPGAFRFLPPVKDSCAGGNSGGGSGFVTKLNSTGTLPIYSTYISGSADDSVGSVKIDSAGDAFVTGRTFSLDYPVTANAIQPTAAVCSYGCTEAIVTVLNSSGTALVYSSYLGGDGSNGGIGFNAGYGLALDSSSNVYVTGYTNSATFPTTPGAFQTSTRQLLGQRTAFVTKVSGIIAPPPPLVP